MKGMYWLGAVLLSVVLALSVAQAQEASGDEASMETLAQKTANPVSDIWMMLFQNDTAYIDGDATDGRWFNSLKFMPVMPISLMDDQWNLVIRPVIPLISSPYDKDLGNLLSASPGDGSIVSDDATLSALQDPYERSTGLGDTVLLTLMAPNRDDGLIWGLGLSQIFPTASDDIFGAGKWQAGPAALIGRLGTKSGGLGIDNWNIGLLAQQWWSYAGDDDRKDTSVMNIQYFINWKMNSTDLIGMTPNININWKADGSDKYSVPVGLGYVTVVKIGRMPLRIGVEAQYYVMQPDAVGPEWNFRFFFAPIILNPFK